MARRRQPITAGAWAGAIALALVLALVLGPLAAVAFRAEGAGGFGPADWAAYFGVEDGRLVLRQGQSESADATVSGSLLSLARLAGPEPDAVIRSGAVSISGDTDIANDFRALLDLLRPDWEEELARLIGDPLAYEAGRAFRDLRAWSRRTRQSLGRSFAEYLTEESRDLAAPAELRAFSADVNDLSLAVDRAEARLRQLQVARTERDTQ